MIEENYQFYCFGRTVGGWISSSNGETHKFGLIRKVGLLMAHEDSDI